MLHWPDRLITKNCRGKFYEIDGLWHLFVGYLWKDKSECGVRKILEEGIIPLDRLVVKTDAPFMYPNTRASKLPQYVKDSLTEK